MKLSEGRINKEYKIKSFRLVTDNGIKHFYKLGIEIGTKIHLIDFTNYGYFLCCLTSPDGRHSKLGIKFEDASIIIVEEV